MMPGVRQRALGADLRLGARSWLTVLVSLVSAAPAIPQALDFAPDGAQVAYSWPAGASPSLMMIAPVGNASQSKGSTIAAASSCEPKWSPDGRHVLLQNAGSEKGAALFDSTTGAAKGLGVSIASPYAWREDGRRFAGVRTLEDGAVEAVCYELPDAGVTLHVPLPFARASAMVWLPNTDDIAVLGGGPQGYDVCTVEAGEVHRITTSHDVLGMALSVDRTKLVWARRSPNTRYILFSLYSFDLKRRSVVRLPFPDRVQALNPDPRHAPRTVDEVRFSPDGSRIAVLATFDATGSPFGTRALYVMGIGGSPARQVVTLPAVGTDTDLRVLVPRWSRDGKLLGVLQGTAGAAQLTVYEADGSNPRTIARQ